MKKTQEISRSEAVETAQALAEYLRRLLFSAIPESAGGEGGEERVGAPEFEWSEEYQAFIRIK